MAESDVCYVILEGLEKREVSTRTKPKDILEMAFKKKFALTIFAVQLIFIVLFAFFVEYGQQLDANQDKYAEKLDPNGDEFHALYSMFQDINALIFIGVGFLYSFLKKYGYMGVGMNMLLAAISVQWSIFTHNWWFSSDGKIHIDIKSIISGEFAAASVVISLGAIFGKSSPLQMVMFTLIETFIYTTNEHFCMHLMKICDIGGSVSLHLFAATFGLATAYTMDKKRNVKDNINDEPSYQSNLFCMLGTILLWCYWPSFNSALSVGDTQHRAALNTFLAFLSSCLAAFAASSLLDPNSKFSMHHIQNATLAGGVAIGATCDLMIQPFGALLIGALGGTLCVFGFNYFGPFLDRKHIFDPCGINSLHGLPGVLSGLTSIIMLFFATEDIYGQSLYKYYPAMTPIQNSTAGVDIVQSGILMGTNRTATFQAGFQFLYIIECFFIAVITGLITGAFLRLKCFDPLEEKHLYLDEVFWNIPENKQKHSINNRQSADAKV